MPATAANGDVLHAIYSTDILTYLDGIPIQGYNIGGNTMICLEDLANYGFSVYYNEEIRCLFVNKQGVADKDFNPIIERGTVGDIIGYTYETDIKAMLNGEEIYVENIGGKLAVAVENLDDLKDSNLSGCISIKNYPKYFMMQTYNDHVRVVNIYSNIEISNLYEKNITNFENDINNNNVATEILNIYNSDDFSQYIYRGAYRESYIHDNSLTAVRFYKSGRILDYSDVLRKYFFIGNYGQGTSLQDSETLGYAPNFLDDGNYLAFNAYRNQPDENSLMGSMMSFENGDYMMNLDTCELIKVKTESNGFTNKGISKNIIWP